MTSMTNPWCKPHTESGFTQSISKIVQMGVVSTSAGLWQITIYISLSVIPGICPLSPEMLLKLPIHYENIAIWESIKKSNQTKKPAVIMAFDITHWTSGSQQTKYLCPDQSTIQYLCSFSFQIWTYNCVVSCHKLPSGSTLCTSAIAVFCCSEE